ncbi:galactokinase [Marinitoga sp. 1197]|uniref:galactokinase n=1 Tax=Marinitoga sp. 1197 TaxID=1428449 RepID=UPI000640E204|nr:galactokinase [Marinitoga sp. 1197]KLO21999.1 galactokinase [Marinitoga sp. 1197]
MKYKAPGRINIIGEHTDYNDGYVLPFAINKYIFLDIKKSDKFLFHSKNLNQEISINELRKTNTWADYIIGIILEIKKKYSDIPPMKFHIDSTLPIGAGLSSSAALEIVSAYAINDIFNLNLTKEEIAKISWKVENQYIGLNCGIMDQYASALSKEKNALLIDTFTKKYEYIPLNLKDYNFYIINSGVKHELGNTEYNIRKKQCNLVLEKLNKKTFKDVSYDDLYFLDNILYKRAKHILDENNRVLKTVDALKMGNIEIIGEYLFESHESLKNLYEVSCEEIDFIVEYLKNKICGARIVGGGFGGSVLILSKKNKIEYYINDLSYQYEKKFNIKLHYFKVESSNGVDKIE